MQTAQGFGMVFFAFWVIIMLGSIAAGVFFILAAWKAMRAHESIAESMRVIAGTLQDQNRTAVSTTENRDKI